MQFLISSDLAHRLFARSLAHIAVHTFLFHAANHGLTFKANEDNEVCVCRKAHSMFTPKTSLDPEDAAQDQHSAPSAVISNFPISEVRVRRAWKFMALLIIARPLTPPKYEVLPAFYFDGISRPSEASKKKKTLIPPNTRSPPKYYDFQRLQFLPYHFIPKFQLCTSLFYQKCAFCPKWRVHCEKL